MSFSLTISPLALVALSSFTTSFVSPPASAAGFFANKSIDLLIGAPPAGGYDIYARALARHYGHSIPGNPSIIPKNMPGAASGRAAGFLSTIAPKDGTVIAAVMPGAVMGSLLDDKSEVLFDPTKVRYLGTANNGTRVCVSYKDSKIISAASRLGARSWQKCRYPASLVPVGLGARRVFSRQARFRRVAGHAVHRQDGQV